jgi:hypothetical protein
MEDKGPQTSKQNNMEDLHKRWKHRWLNPKVKPFKSKIHGLV